MQLFSAIIGACTLENSSSTSFSHICISADYIIWTRKNEGCNARKLKGGKRRRVFLLLYNFQRKRTLAGFACVSRLARWRNKIYSLENICRVLNLRDVSWLECSKCSRLLKLNIKYFFLSRFKVKYFVTRKLWYHQGFKAEIFSSKWPILFGWTLYDFFSIILLNLEQTVGLD